MKKSTDIGSLPNKRVARKQFKPSVAFTHLGCEKNRVDTEHMLGLLAEAGYGVSTNEADAAVVVVNTW